MKLIKKEILFIYLKEKCATLMTDDLVMFQTSLNNPKYDAQSMVSSDGETVPFISTTALEGPVEVSV